MTKRDSTPASRSRSSRLFTLFPGDRNTGAAAFLRVAIHSAVAIGAMAAIQIGDDWAQGRREVFSGSVRMLVILGGGFFGFFLLISLVFYVWERRLRRELQERSSGARGAHEPHD